MKYILALILALSATAAYASPVVTAHVATAKGAVPLKLETVTTAQTRAHGLMERKTLAPNDGMLFVFPDLARRAFWMKNTPLPLDILFLDTEGKIIHIAPNTTPYSETPIDSAKPAHSVIELGAGQAAATGINVNDTVTYTLPVGTHVE